jgi:hypothetical protein
MKNNPEIVGGNIIEHVMHMQDARDVTLKHFSFKSKLVRAIQDHVLNATDCTLIDKGGRTVNRLGGIQVKNVVTPYAMPGECQMLNIEFVVALNALETDYPEYDLGNDIEKRMDVYAPSDLELNFTKEKFDLWLGTMREKRSKELYGKNLQLLKDLVQKYPAAAKTALASIRAAKRKK